jgi:hypothetical protein
LPRPLQIQDSLPRPLRNRTPKIPKTS